MSCGRVRRELLEIVRFGDFGPSAASHLEHLSNCRHCRDEVGFDRALVAQLRRALEARVDPEAPPSRAWYAILREVQRPEPGAGVLTWSASLVGWLRTGTAMAGTGLALLLVLQMEVVPVPSPDRSPAAGVGSTVLEPLHPGPSERLGAEPPTRRDGSSRSLASEDERGISADGVMPESAPTDQAPGELRLMVRPVPEASSEIIFTTGSPPEPVDLQREAPS
ncbi:hypothetical protein BH20CHL8_BH20CHL8_10410 [soil metagenome]